MAVAVCRCFVVRLPHDGLNGLYVRPGVIDHRREAVPEDMWRRSMGIDQAVDAFVPPPHDGKRVKGDSIFKCSFHIRVITYQ